ncbi:MAG TPA: hypothetical protein VI916_13295 [Acidimicrobiia bacterium]|nr:hypothetical protein [Acidimicrobiia bacterium]
MKRARIAVRTLVVGFTIGALLAGASLAGVVVDPMGIGTGSTPDPTAALGAAPPPVDLVASGDGAPVAGDDNGDHEILPNEIADVVGSTIPAPTGPKLESGFRVGAARASLYPTPALFGGSTWQTEGCTSIDDAHLDTADHVVQSIEDLRGWPAASPDCIYLGGFGIGPARVAKRVGHGGVWVRAVAISNGQDTFVYAVADTVGWFARYDATICADCGVLDVRESVAADLELPVGNVILGSTHTHAGADTYGGWGGIPDWYRNQIRDAAIAATKRAVESLRAATVTIGATQLPNRNNERRDTYYSNADPGATWIRATDTIGAPIATWATYAAHPTIVDTAVLHADWPGAAARRFEAAGGGVGMVFEGGLGNVSVSGTSGVVDCGALGITGKECDAEDTGAAIGDAILGDIEDGGLDDSELEDNEMTPAVQTITHPVATNPGLTTLAAAGFFDREFTPGTKGAGLPGVYHWSRRGEVSSAGEPGTLPDDPEDDRGFANGCDTAGPTIITTAGAHKIGSLLVAFAPGEIFSNLAEVIKERADNNSVAMVLGQTNDALGYIIQSFEFDTAANAATHYGGGTNEYEEVFSVDRCFGDHVLETILESTRALGFGG